MLDEPTAGVDPAGSREIRDLILDLKRRGITVLLSSHLLAQVQEICDRVGILAHGVLVREGRVADLLAIENQTELILRKCVARKCSRRSPSLLEKSAHSTGSSSASRRPRSSGCSSKRPTVGCLTSHENEQIAWQPRRSLFTRRIAALTGNTFTELVRLKVFYFLLLFALLLIGSSLFMAQLSFQQEFQVLKDVSLGAMSIFTSLLAIVATARFIPQDIEERTIYTILAKPVPRYEYLLGKLIGVLLLARAQHRRDERAFFRRAFR